MDAESAGLKSQLSQLGSRTLRKKKRERNKNKSGAGGAAGAGCGARALTEGGWAAGNGPARTAAAQSALRCESALPPFSPPARHSRGPRSPAGGGEAASLAGIAQQPPAACVPRAGCNSCFISGKVAVMTLCKNSYEVLGRVCC